MFLFDNHCVRLISELKWDDLASLALFHLHPEKHSDLFIFIQCIYNEIAFKMHVNYQLHSVNKTFVF